MTANTRDSRPRGLFRRRTVWGLVLAVGVLAVAAAGRWLPAAGLRWGVSEALRGLGMAEVALEGADLSLFGGTVVVRGVRARAGTGAPLDLGGLLLDFRWRPLLSRRLSLRSLDLENARLDLRREGAAWVVNGLPLAAEDAGGGDWRFDADTVRLTASRLTVADAGVRLDIEIDELAVDNLRPWDAEAELAYRLKGKVNGARVAVEGTATPLAPAPAFALSAIFDGVDLAHLAGLAERSGLAAPTGRLSGELRLAGRAEATAMPLKAEGTLSASDLTLAARTVGAAAGRLRWSGSAEWRDGAAILAGGLAAKGLRVTTGDGTVEAHAADWAGTARITGDGTLRAEGRLEVADMAGRLGEHRVDHARAGADGSFEILPPGTATGIMPPIAGALTLWVEGLVVGEPATGRTIATAERVEARGVEFSPAAGGTVARIEATGLEAKDGRIRVAAAAAERAAMTPAGDISAAVLALSEVTARLVRTGAGFEGFPAATGEGGGALPRIALGQVEVSGGRVRFLDRTPSEPVRLTVDGIELSAHDLDTGAPDRDSPFRLKARLRGADISAQGTLRPFAETLSARITGRVASLDLPPLSPYAADTLGVHLHTGQFDGELSVAVDRGALDGRMDMVLSKLFVAQPDPKAPLAVKTDMQVEAVLDLLRDSEQRIRLTIPVRGDLASPDFDVSDAVSQAVGGALKSTVVTTLKVAFPVVALIGFVIDDASTPRLSLQPVEFDAGSHEPAPPQLDRLAAVGELLRQRPGIRLNLCGVAIAAADSPALAERRRQRRLDLIGRLRTLVGPPEPAAGDSSDRDALSALAGRRAQAVKDWLVQEAGIDPGRLFVCRSSVSDGADGGGGGPRVDLLI